jgi:hypothetical protein
MSTGPTADTPVLQGMLAADGTLARDLVCRACGYNLRGLRVDGCCPECGTPVEASLKADLLELADPSWLRRLEHGARLTLWAIKLLCVAVVPIAAVPLAMGNAGYRYLLWPALFAAAVGLAALVGAWLFTSPMPHDALRGFRFSKRWFARAGLASGWVLAVLVPLVLGYGGLAQAAFWVAAGATAPLTVGLCSMAWYMAHLAERAGDRKTARSARRYAGFEAVAWPGAALTIFLGETGLHVGTLSDPCFSTALAVGGVIVGALILALPQRLARRLQECRAEAERTWGAPAVTTQPPTT